MPTKLRGEEEDRIFSIFFETYLEESRIFNSPSEDLSTTYIIDRLDYF